VRSARRDGGAIGHLPPVLLAAAVAVSLALLLEYGAGLNFFADEWSWVIYRRGFSASAFFAPHVEHISVLPVAFYKLLMASFGLTSTAPYRIVSIALLAATAFVLFAYLRRRVGDWLALLACLLLLFMGAAWADLLWPFEMTLVGSLAAGVGMLVALERRDRRGDLGACGLLTISILCSSLGISFVLAAVVDVVQRRAEWRRRLFIPLVPFAIYVAWYAAYGYRSDHHVTIHNVLTSPIYLVNGIGSGLQSLLGLLPALGTGHDVTWGWLALAVAAVAVMARLRRGPRPRAELWPAAVAAASFWLLAGADLIPGREPTQSRYQYVGAALVLMVLAELFRGVRPRRTAVWVGVVALVALAVASSIRSLDQAHDYLRTQTALSRADLGAIEVARRTVDPAFAPTQAVAGPLLLPVTAGPYLAAADALGSPADSPAELARAPGVDRAWADDVLGHALPVRLSATAGTPRPAGRAPSLRSGRSLGAREAGPCAVVPAGARRGVVFAPRSATTLIRLGPGSAAIVQAQRFATGSYPLAVGGVDGGTQSALEIPRDRWQRPWRVRLYANQRVSICSASRRTARR
jgi:hypothetical protein